jgi:hypothetical protein
MKITVIVEREDGLRNEASGTMPHDIPSAQAWAIIKNIASGPLLKVAQTPVTIKAGEECNCGDPHLPHSHTRDTYHSLGDSS